MTNSKEKAEKTENSSALFHIHRRSEAIGQLLHPKLERQEAEYRASQLAEAETLWQHRPWEPVPGRENLHCSR